MQNLNYDDNSRFYFNKELNKWVIEIKSIIEINRNSDLHQVLSQMNQIKNTPQSDPVIETTPKKKSQEISCLQEFEDLFESKNDPVDYLTAIGNILEPESKPSVNQQTTKRRSLKGLRKAARAYRQALASGELTTTHCSKEEAIAEIEERSPQPKPIKSKLLLKPIERKGFYYNKQAKKFQAYFGVGAGKQLYLGLYETEVEARHATLRARLEYKAKGSVTLPFICPKMGYYLKGNQWDVCFYNPLTKKSEFVDSFDSALEAREAYFEAIENIIGE